jgi:hypothetical protein
MDRVGRRQIDLYLFTEGKRGSPVLAYTSAGSRSAPAHFLRRAFRETGAGRKHTMRLPRLTGLTMRLSDLIALFPLPRPPLKPQAGVAAPSIVNDFCHVRSAGDILSRIELARLEFCQGPTGASKPKKGEREILR